MSDDTDLGKLAPGTAVLAGGLGILSLRDPWLALGTSVSLSGMVLIVYAVLRDILDRFNMTLADLL